MKNLIILSALAIIFLQGCGGSSSEQQQKKELETKVLGIHDEAMAKMDDIAKLRRNLRKLKEAQPDTSVQAALQQDIDGLNQADEVMMNWMRNYNAPDTLQHEQAITYLNTELVKIEKVKTTMDSTLAAARQTLAQHEQK